MATTNPVDIARLGHRVGLYMHYPAAGFAEIWVDRVQTVTPSFANNMESYYELGSFDPVGYGSDPADLTLALTQNLLGRATAVQGPDDVELLMAGKNPATFLKGNYNLGDYINTAGSLIAYVMYRANGASVASNEFKLDKLSIEELSWQFQVGRPSTFNARLRGTKGNYLTASLHNTTWGAGAAKSTGAVGAIRGRDVRLYFGGSTATEIAYRIQSLNVRAAFPITPVNQLGDRDLVGNLADAADVTADFEVAAADAQPIDQFFQSGTNFDINSPVAVEPHLYVRVFDPASAAAFPSTGTVMRAFKLEGVMPLSGDIGVGQVRGLTTHRYQLRVAKTATAGSGGLIAYKGDFV